MRAIPTSLRCWLAGINDDFSMTYGGWVLYLMAVNGAVIAGSVDQIQALVFEPATNSTGVNFNGSRSNTGGGADSDTLNLIIVDNWAKISTNVDGLLSSIGGSQADVGIVLVDDAGAIRAAAEGGSSSVWGNLDQVRITDPESPDFGPAMSAINQLQANSIINNVHVSTERLLVLLQP